MNPAGKKFISLFLVFSLITINCAIHINTFGQEKRGGAKLIITLKDGKQIEGELFAVKKDSLILLHSRVIEVSVGIEEIKVTRIKRKSKILTWIAVGAGVSGGTVAVVIFTSYLVLSPALDGEPIEGRVLFPGIGIGMGIGALIGGIIGVFVARGNDKIIRLMYMNDWEIQKTLDKLRKKARIRNYK